MKYEIVSEVGSDASYDLIVEAIRPCPVDMVIFEYLTELRGQRAQTMIKDIREYLKTISIPPELGLRIRFAQRIPDPFVWQARIDAALSEESLDSNNFCHVSNVGQTFFMSD
jgi:hypothetical protein